MSEFEKQILRINAHEVHIKKLLKFEEQFRTYMYGIGKEEKKRNSWRESKNEVNKKVQEESSLTVNLSILQELNKYEKKLDDLTWRFNKLEQMIQDMTTPKSDSYSQFLPQEEAIVKEERLHHLVEQILADKLADHIQTEETMLGKIKTLENQISQLLERENTYSNIRAVEEENKAEERGVKDPQTYLDRMEGIGYEWGEEGHPPLNAYIQMRFLALENNYLLVNEVQTGLLKRVDDLLEKWNALTLNKNKLEAEDLTMQQEPAFKTLYIDKLYLDKYEQNNNFAQLGIKELSGALNIGATYGKDAIPKEVTEQVKEDIAKMKALKEEMEKQQTPTDPPPDLQYDESSSDLHSSPPEDKEEESYTEIFIEEDPSFEEE